MRPRGRCREQGPAVWTGWDVLAALVPALCDWKCVCVCASLQTSIGSEMLRLKAQSASCTLSPPGPGRLALGPGEVWETRRAWLSVALSVPGSLHPRAHRKDPPPKDGEVRSRATQPSWSPSSLTRCLLEETSRDRAQQTTGASSCPLERRGLAQAPQIRHR